MSPAPDLSTESIELPTTNHSSSRINSPIDELDFDEHSSSDRDFGYVIQLNFSGLCYLTN